MLKARIAVLVTLVVLIVGFVGFHLVERALHGGRPPSFLEEVLFIGHALRSGDRLLFYTA